jgi:hypothetical protein
MNNIRITLATISFTPVRSEAGLVMKEDRTMSQRLRVKQWFTTIIAVGAVLIIMALVSLPLGTAGEGKNIVQKVRDAKTPADQQAIAAFFEKEAQAAQQAAKQHNELKAVYATKPDMQTMVSHCDMLVKDYQEIAKELEGMAEMHKKMAKMGGMGR